MIPLSFIALQAMSMQPALPPHAPAKVPNARYAACPGANEVLTTGSNLSWKRSASTLEKHQRLRSQLGVRIPEGASRILWYGVGGDLATTTFSVIATRSPTGLWHVDGAGQNQIWIKGASPTPMPRVDRTLSVEESRDLDGLLVDRCLYAGPTFADNPRITAGGLVETLEIAIPAHHWIGGWHGMATAQEQEITNLLVKQ